MLCFFWTQARSSPPSVGSLSYASLSLWLVSGTSRIEEVKSHVTTYNFFWLKFWWRFLVIILFSWPYDLSFVIICCVFAPLLLSPLSRSSGAHFCIHTVDFWSAALKNLEVAEWRSGALLTLTTTYGHLPSTSSTLYCLVIGTYTYEQPAQSCCKSGKDGSWTKNLFIASPMPYLYATLLQTHSDKCANAVC